MVRNVTYMRWSQRNTRGWRCIRLLLIPTPSRVSINSGMRKVKCGMQSAECDTPREGLWITYQIVCRMRKACSLQNYS